MTGQLLRLITDVTMFGGVFDRPKKGSTTIISHCVGVAMCRRVVAIGLLCGLASGPAVLAQMQTVKGVPGASGTDGTGQDGVSGGNAVADKGVTESRADGGAGGDGGSGKRFAQGAGGDGGRGGAPGSATASATNPAGAASAIAVGGTPGKGATGAFGTTGGRGGNAGIAGAQMGSGDATATASAGGNGNASASASGSTGGPGGNGGTGTSKGGGGGDGAQGGNATATATATGTGNSHAGVKGGDGGKGGVGGKATDFTGAGGNGGTGGNGGNARASATTTNGTSADAVAFGGHGGNAGGSGSSGKGVERIMLPFPGFVGNGATASAFASSTNKAGDTLATAGASGGNSGQVDRLVNGMIRPVYNGQAGGAVATALADASGTATARPNATAGNGGPRPDQRGLALALGRAVGAGGIIGSVAISTNLFRDVRDVEANVTNPLPARAGGGRAAATSQTEAIIGGSAPAPPPKETLQGLAVAVGAPLHSDVVTASAGKPVVTQAILSAGTTVLGLTSLGLRYVDLESQTPGVFEPIGTEGPSVTAISSVTYTLDRLRLGNQDLMLGLLDSSFTGSGFDSLEFRVVEDGTTIRDLLFPNLAAATSFFNDKVLDLGSPIGDSSSPLALRFDLLLTASKVGDGFTTDFLVASVPEPSGVVMLGTALAGLSAIVWFRRRRTVVDRRRSFPFHLRLRRV
jgi:hypothetical protein